MFYRKKKNNKISNHPKITRENDNNVRTEKNKKKQQQMKPNGFPLSSPRLNHLRDICTYV